MGLSMSLFDIFNHFSPKIFSSFKQKKIILRVGCLSLVSIFIFLDIDVIIKTFLS